MGETEKLLTTIDESRSLLGIGRSTLYELIDKGEIKVVRVGRAVRIPMTELRAFVERHIESAS